MFRTWMQGRWGFLLLAERSQTADLPLADLVGRSSKPFFSSWFWCDAAVDLHSRSWYTTANVHNGVVKVLLERVSSSKPLFVLKR